MRLKAASGIILTLLLIGMLALTFNIQTAEAKSTNSTYPSPSNDNEKPSTWYSPRGIVPRNFEESGKVVGSSRIELKYYSIDSSENRIYLLVASSVYSDILSSLNQYVADVESLGFSISIYSGSWGTPEEVRTFLQQGLLNGMKGCLLIGDIPGAWYEMDNTDPLWPPHEEFPMDLYYMDLNGDWTDIDEDGRYDGHSGDVSPEIWVGRLKASNLDGDEALLLKNYFNKIHYYRAGIFTLPQRALVYVDDTWIRWAYSDDYAIRQIYDETTLVIDNATTNAEDYKNRLVQGYEWVDLRCHGSAFSHTFHTPIDQGDGYGGTVYSSDYRSISPDAFFYQLYVCSAARYTESNYLGGSCIFADTSGLLAIGSTKTGGMNDFYSFCWELGGGSTIGDAFKEWFRMYGESKPKYSYGLTILGDPLLKPCQSPNRPSINLALVSISHYSTYTIDEFDFLDYSYDTYDEGNLTLLFSGTPKRLYNYDAVVMGHYAATSTEYPIEAGIVRDVLTENAVAAKTYVESGSGLAVSAQHSYSWLPIEFQSYTDLGDRIGGEINEYCLTHRMVKKPNELTFCTGDKTKPTNDDLYAHHFSVWEGESVGTQHGIYTSIARDDWTLLSDVTTWLAGVYGKGKISLTTMVIDYYCGHSDTEYSAFYRRRLPFENMMYWLTQPIRVRLDYPTIQTAINAANPSQLVHVTAGTYYENIVLNNSVSLVGENPIKTVIDGSWSGKVIGVTASNVVIENFTIRNSGQGPWDGGVILESYARNCTIMNNNIANNSYGILLSGSDHSIYGNNITNNSRGMTFHMSSNNVVSGNVMNANKYNFDVVGWELHISLSYYMHSVDDSNLVDGKPVYYLVNQQNLDVNSSTHPQVGYLALINSTNITVEGLTLANNGEGLLVAYTKNSEITNSTITNNDEGIHICASENNWISGNRITNNSLGIGLAKGAILNIISGNYITNNGLGIGIYEAGNTTIAGNNITNNSWGIDLSWSNDNTIFGNNIISNHEVGISATWAFSNEFYHNNLIYNTQQAEVDADYVSIDWDDGYPSGGNYWSNYDGADSDHDGIGDIQYEIDSNNIDHYPLMGMFHSFDTSAGYYVNVISNSIVEDFQYFESNSTIRMYISNVTANQTFGFCRVTIPEDLMAPPYVVTIDDGLTEILLFNESTYDNDTHWWIYFAYEHSTHEVVIQSDSTPPTIFILSPENKTYSIGDVPLNFTVDEAASWMGYSLDGQTNMTITGNTTLTSLLDGSHYVIVYANDTAGNMGASGMVYFTVDTTPPNITEVSQVPPENNVQPEDEVIVNATVIDAVGGVERVALNYTNGNGTWVMVEMTSLSVHQHVWIAIIPSFPYGTNVTYVILAEDNAGNTVTTDELGYEYQYQVIPEFPSFLVLSLLMITTLLALTVYRCIHGAGDAFIQKLRET